jgi:hypothetical protein
MEVRDKVRNLTARRAAAEPGRWQHDAWGRVSLMPHWHIVVVAILSALAVLSAPVLAANYIVDVDREVEFSSKRTFSFRSVQIQSERPELNSELVRDHITAAVRSALLAKGLTEASLDADLLVDLTATGQRFGINEWRNAILLDNVSGARGLPPGSPWRNLPEAFVEGMLAVDLTIRSSDLLVWRGVYRNREKSSARLAHQLPAYATKLLAAYPGRGK